jgi:hypothetical protein
MIAESTSQISAMTLTREWKKARVRRNYWRRKATATADSSRDVDPL